MLVTKATRLAEVLPEREQLGFKSTMLVMSKQYDGYYRLLESALQLYPYEYWPYGGLVSYYEVTYGVDSAIVLMKQAAVRSDRESALRELYRLYFTTKDFDAAETVIKDLDREFATPEETRRRYAGLYQGRIEAPRARLEVYFEELAGYDQDAAAIYTCAATMSMTLNGRIAYPPNARLSDCEETMAVIGSAAVTYVRLAMAIAAGQFKAAADQINDQIENGTNTLSANIYVRIQRLAGRLDRAEELLQEELKLRPNVPELLLEKARIAIARGNNEAAKAPLKSVLDTWRDADPGHLDRAAALDMAARIGLTETR